MTRETPEFFDWVNALRKCSLEGVFRSLTEVIDSDVKAANASPRAGVAFHFDRHASNKVGVRRERDFAGILEIDSVIFELGRNVITATARDVLGAATNLLTANSTFTQAGECFLTVDGDDLRLWQVSRKALQDLFFGF